MILRFVVAALAVAAAASLWSNIRDSEDVATLPTALQTFSNS
jgi:hypothetical protein